MSRARPATGRFGPREVVALGTASWLLALCGLWLLVSTGLDFVAGRRAEAWPTVEGVITSSATRQVPVDRFLPWQTWFSAAYEYRVDSVPHAGSRVVFGGVLPLDFRPAQLAAGSTVTVHYNPAHPEEAVLFPGGGISLFIYAVVGFFFLAVSFGLRRHIMALQALAPRRSRRRRAAI